MENAERAIVYLLDGTVKISVIAVSEDESIYDKILFDDNSTATFHKLSRGGSLIYIQDEKTKGLF